MNPVRMVVPARSSGWIGGGFVPLLTPVETETHSALVAAGFSVQIVRDEAAFAAVRGQDVLVVAVGGEALEKLERMSFEGTKILSIEDPVLPDQRRKCWSQRISLEGSQQPFFLSRASRHGRRRGIRARLALSSGVRLEPRAGSSVMARWGAGAGIALLKEPGARAEVWRAGFSLDRLAPAHVAEIAGRILGSPPRRETLRSPLPEGFRAVVILIHDVEEPLPDDPRGLLSVRWGTETCLDLQAQRGLKATYNLVGDFGAKIADLAQRMVAEGHEVASHGQTHRVVADLSVKEMQEEVKGAENRIREAGGGEIQGFRSPRSRWSGCLLKVLSETGYRWNAEADDSPYPYPVPSGAEARLIRLPVAADDWDFVKRGAPPRRVLNLWKREVRSAMRRGAWIALGSHPSVLGAHRERMEVFRELLSWLVDQEVKVMTAGEGAAWWRARTWEQGSRRDLDEAPAGAGA